MVVFLILRFSIYIEKLHFSKIIFKVRFFRKCFLSKTEFFWKFLFRIIPEFSGNNFEKKISGIFEEKFPEKWTAVHSCFSPWTVRSVRGPFLWKITEIIFRKAISETNRHFSEIKISRKIRFFSKNKTGKIWLNQFSLYKNTWS